MVYIIGKVSSLITANIHCIWTQPFESHDTRGGKQCVWAVVMQDEPSEQKDGWADKAIGETLIRVLNATAMKTLTTPFLWKDLDSVET